MINKEEKERQIHNCLSQLAAYITTDDSILLINRESFLKLVEEFESLKSDSELEANFNQIASKYGLTPEIQSKIIAYKALNDMNKDYFYMVEKKEQDQALAEENKKKLAQFVQKINEDAYQILKNLDLAKKAVDEGLITADDTVTNPLTGEQTTRHVCMLDIAKKSKADTEKLIQLKRQNDTDIFKIIVYMASLDKEKQQKLIAKIKKNYPKIYQEIRELMPTLVSENFMLTLRQHSKKDIDVYSKEFLQFLNKEVDTSTVTFDKICTTFEQKQAIDQKIRSLYHICKSSGEFNSYMLNHQKNPMSLEAKENLSFAVRLDISSTNLLKKALFMYNAGKEDESAIILLSWRNLRSQEKRHSLLDVFQNTDPENYPATLSLIYKALFQQRKLLNQPISTGEYEQSIPFECFIKCFKDSRGNLELKKKLLQQIKENDPEFYKKVSNQLNQENPQLAKNLGISLAISALNQYAQNIVDPQPIAIQTRIDR